MLVFCGFLVVGRLVICGFVTLTGWVGTVVKLLAGLAVVAVIFEGLGNSFCHVILSTLPVGFKPAAC